ncbi:hypothetical protein AMTR_s01989p00009110, partial [Amborella trichopoda]
EVGGKYLEKDEEHISELNRKEQSSKKRWRERDYEERLRKTESIAYLKINNIENKSSLIQVLKNKHKDQYHRENKVNSIPQDQWQGSELKDN